MLNLIKYSTKYINQAVNNQFRTSKNKHFNNLLITKFCKKINVNLMENTPADSPKN